MTLLLDRQAELARYVLSPAEFEVLSVLDQRRYLGLLGGLLEEEPPFEFEPKQALASEMAGFCDEILYGGAAGGGKSAFLIRHQHQMAVAHPGHRGLHLRSTNPEIEMSTLPDSIEMYATVPEEERPTWVASKKRWVYGNGSWIQYGHLELQSHVMRYLSTAWELITFDELTEFQEKGYRMLGTRARNTERRRRQGVRPHVASGSNPGGPGHSWVKRRFPLSPEGDYGPREEPGGVEEIRRSYRSPTTGEMEEVSGFLRRVEVKMPADPRTGEQPIEWKTIGFIRSTVLDNPHISRDYIKELASQPEVTQQQYLFGNWEIREGMFFSEFRRTKLFADREVPWHVVPSFEPPADWFRAKAFDHGFAKHFACVWAAWDPDGRMFVYREAYAKDLVPRQQAELVLRLEEGERRRVPGIGDPAMWHRKESPETVAIQLAKAGLRLAKADNDRIGGWAKVREYLMPMPVLVDGEREERPGLSIMSSCPNLIRTLPDLAFSDTDPEDLNSNQEDHLADCLRYLCKLRPRRARDPVEEKPGLQGVEEKRQRAWKRQRRGRAWEPPPEGMGG